MDTKDKPIEEDLKNRMKNVKQWFHKVGTAAEKKDFIFQFISDLTVKTDKRPRIIIFFNSKEFIEEVYREMQKDVRLKEIEE